MDYNNEIIKEYDLKRSLYEVFTEKIGDLIYDLLEESGIVVHSVTARTKEKEKLIEKVNRKEKDYKKLEDITDLSGIRIICLFSEEVNSIARIIETNFKVSHEFSIDISKTIDPDRFGYLSLHYVVKLHDKRTILPEYSKYRDLFCEIQIRSILQHAWAEIEHDLGYKSHIEIPRDVKRRFHRLAGLLEIADDEFCSLKSDIEEYKKEVKEKIKKEEKLLIDKISLESYITTSPIIKELNGEIARLLNATIDNKVKLNESDLKLLKFFRITTINKLDSIIKGNKLNIINFAKKWIAGRTLNHYEILDPSISIFYLGYTLAAKTNDDNRIREYVKNFNFDPGAKVAERIIAISKEIEGERTERDEPFIPLPQP